MYDFPEFTYRYRKDQGLRGFDWQDFVNDPDESIYENELEIFKYPSDEVVSSVGLRGLFIGNFDPWDTEKHTKLVEAKYGWQRSPTPFERTYRLTSNLDDMYENGAHDYLKFIKFGYGRATDHASKDIRAGRLSRRRASGSFGNTIMLSPQIFNTGLNMLIGTKIGFGILLINLGRQQFGR